MICQALKTYDGAVVFPFAEAMAVALPLCRRAKGAGLGGAVSAERGTEPLKDADLKPCAARAGLVRKAGGAAD